MEKTLRYLTLIAAILLVLPAYSASVGKNDGKAGPSLPPVATPSLGEVKEETMVDWSFPAHLAQTEDWPSAVLAYQELAWKVSGPAKVEALRQVGFAQEQNSQLGAALQTYQNLLMLPLVAKSTSLTTEFSAKATATHFARLSVPPGPSPHYLTHLLTIPEEKNPWSLWALQTVAWHELMKTHHLSQTFDIPQLISLQKDVYDWNKSQIIRKNTVALLEVIPGTGLFYLGDRRAGVGTFAIWLLSLTLAIGTFRNRQYAASACWWIVLGIIMVSAPTLGAQRSSQISTESWTGQLQSWKETYPNPRPTERTPEHISWLPNIPNTATAAAPDLNAIQPAAGPTSKP